MKLSKANEDTLKGIAAFLKDLGAINNTTDLATMQKAAKAFEKDLRQLRKSIKELPESVLITGDGDMPEPPQVESEFEETPACYANPTQLSNQQKLLGVAYGEPSPMQTLPLYRKRTQ